MQLHFMSKLVMLRFFASCIGVTAVRHQHTLGLNSTSSLHLVSVKDQLHASKSALSKHQTSETTTPEPEGGHMVVPNTVSEWSGVSSIPQGVQLLMAFSWIGCLCSIPAVLRMIDSKPVTRAEATLGVVMVVTLLGGLYLFTNVILFQSPHFHGKIRSLTMIECVYLMAQIITTVGYGDITPAKPRGQVFIGLYVVGALFVISMLFTKLLNDVVEVVQKRRQASEDRKESTKLTREECIAVITGAPPKPDTFNLMKAFGIFLFFDICWILFFHLWPGEGKTLMQAIYMSVITLSTVGFGAFTPVTEAGMIFGSFWMLFGSAAMVNVISNFTTLMVQRHKYEQYDPMDAQTSLEALRREIKGDEMSEAQFLRLAILSQGLIAKDDLDRITDAFASLDPCNGSIKCKELFQLLVSQDA